MDLTAEQVDQLVALEFRKLERDYQQTIAADGKLDPSKFVQGTPLLDSLVAEALLTKESLPKPGLGETAKPSEEEGSWATDEEDDDQPPAGFVRLEDDSTELQNGDDMEKTSSAEIEMRANFEMIEKTKGQKQEGEKGKQVIFEEVVFQKRTNNPVDQKKVQDAMSKINFPAPEWAKK